MNGIDRIKPRLEFRHQFIRVNDIDNKQKEVRKTTEEDFSGIEYVQKMLMDGDVKLIKINSTTITTAGPDAKISLKPNKEGWDKFYGWLNECAVAYRQKYEAVELQKLPGE